MSNKSTLLYGGTTQGASDGKGASEFISKILEASVAIHKAHLMTTGPGSFAAHTALGVYEDLEEAADGLAESYMGCMKTGLSFPGADASEVRKIYDYIEANRGMMGTESHIQNDIDGILTLLSSALFKLDRLA